MMEHTHNIVSAGSNMRPQTKDEGGAVATLLFADEVCIVNGGKERASFGARLAYILRDYRSSRHAAVLMPLAEDKVC